MLLGISGERESSRKNEGVQPKQGQHPAVDVTGDGGKVGCCKEQYCMGTWSVSSMNQGTLEVVKREMARMNVRSLEGLMLKLKLQYFGHLMQSVDSLEDSDAGRDWGQEEKGTTEGEMAGWHHRLDGHEFG